MNVPLRTFGKRTGPVMPTIQRPYPYRYRGMGDNGDDEGGIFDIGTDTGSDPGALLTDESGNTCAAALFIDGQCPGSAAVPYAPINGVQFGTPTPNPTTLTPNPSAPITVVDSSGVSWTCDGSGNCCDPHLTCQVGPPAIANNASGGASSTQQNTSNAQIVQALATAAAKIAGANATLANGSIQCGGGVAVPAGVKCPASATPGIFGCPSGTTFVNGICQAGAPKPAGQWFASMSNGTVLAIGGGVIGVVILISAISSSGGGGRRRR